MEKVLDFIQLGGPKETVRSTVFELEMQLRNVKEGKFKPQLVGIIHLPSGSD